MNLFTVRVVLRDNAPKSDYDQLHDRMEAEFFYRNILADNGSWFELPPAEYQCESESGTAASIRDKVVKIAYSVDANSAVRVTQGPSAWIGLVLAKNQGPTREAPLLPSLPSPFTLGYAKPITPFVDNPYLSGLRRL